MHKYFVLLYALFGKLLTYGLFAQIQKIVVIVIICKYKIIISIIIYIYIYIYKSILCVWGYNGGVIEIRHFTYLLYSFVLIPVLCCSVLLWQGVTCPSIVISIFSRSTSVYHTIWQKKFSCIVWVTSKKCD